MENNRRSFFRTLLSPLVTFVLPKPSLLGVINDGINPAWDGTFKPKCYSVEIPYRLDDINVTTLRYLNESALLDSVFVQSPFSALTMKKKRILDAGGSIVGQFGHIPGKPWERLRSNLRWPGVAPRLPV